ncbi:hypothetical protein L6164_027481 [Bauhinia variegata]|uniref:Uncharacterized protein n=1 Tax=Bauhinia variegata TaxID=167791 RepID=A0ACB9LTH3_BAUVA|nr:hypothetical protein L6164_027481 [Bauhinia variegata]
MATQLVSISNVKCRQAEGHKQECNEAYRERGRKKSSPPSLQNFAYHCIRNSSELETNLGHAEAAKRSSKRSPRAEKLHQLGFSYLESSFRYILTKVKAFCNGFLRDSGIESAMGSEAVMVEPYFSIPVLPNSAPPML